jgi:hypothetical protein
MISPGWGWEWTSPPIHLQQRFPSGLRSVFSSVTRPAPLALLLGAALAVQTSPVQAYVALMAGQRARALNGTFNKVPVLHSNQPEEVTGPGILINSAPGSAYAAETGRPLRNASYEFNGEFGLHLHHKYFPPNRASISPSERRAELTLATILINPGVRPVHIRFQKGSRSQQLRGPLPGQ